jgi:hypothetical protein
MALTRGTSKRLTGRSGSMLRRIASEADLEIGLDSMHHAWQGEVSPHLPPTARQSPSFLTARGMSQGVPPLSPSTTLLTETDIGPSASMSGQTPDFFSARSDVFGSAFSQQTLGRRGARRVPPSREASQFETPVEFSTRGSYVTPASTATGIDSQATIRPTNHRRASDRSDTMSAVSAVTYQTGFLDMLEEESVLDDFQTASQGERRRGPLGPRQSLRIAPPRQNTRTTNYFTATQGTEASYISATSGQPSSPVSSGSHAASAIDRVSATSLTSSRTTVQSVHDSSVPSSVYVPPVSQPPSRTSKSSSASRSTVTSSSVTSSSGTSSSISQTTTSSTRTVRADLKVGAIISYCVRRRADWLIISAAR